MSQGHPTQLPSRDPIKPEPQSPPLPAAHVLAVGATNVGEGMVRVVLPRSSSYHFSSPILSRQQSSNVSGSGSGNNNSGPSNDISSTSSSSSSSMHKSHNREEFPPPPPPGPGPRFFASGVYIPYFKKEPQEQVLEADGVTSLADVSVFAIPAPISIPRTSAPTPGNPSTALIPIATPVMMTNHASRTRKNYTTEQKKRLEAFFLSNPNSSIQERALFASEINETEARVNNWLNRRRLKSRTVGSDHSASSTPNTSPSSTPPPADVPMRQETEESNLPSASSRERSETPSADGVLGSLRYRPYTVPARVSQPLRRAGERNPNSVKLTSLEVAHRLGPLLIGGSVAKPENMLRIADMMASVSEKDGKRYILNALLSTKLRPFQQRFLQTTGPQILGLWIKNAMEDPTSPECEETVMKAISILKALPFDVEKLSESKLGKIIKQIATGKEGSQVLIKSAAELKDQWLGLINSTDTTSLRSNMTSTSVGAKKTPPKGISIPFFGDNQAREMAQLPKFTKAKPALSPGTAPKSPRITSNPGFFNEIAPSPPSTSLPGNKARVSSAHKSHSRVDFGPSSSVANMRHSTISASSETSRSSLDSRPPQSKEPIAPVVIIPQPTPTTANRARSLAFNASSSQHDKAREAGMKLIHKKKTVRFKADFELVQIKYFERVVYEDDEDDEYGAHDQDDERDQDRDRDMDMDQHWRDDGFDGGNAPWGPPWIETRVAVTTNRPTFTMAESVIEELIQGTAWRCPLPLLIVHPPPQNDEEASCELAHGEESLEKEVQARREAITEPQAYMDIASIPQSPAEPEPEQVLDPTSHPQVDQDEEFGGTRAIPLFEPADDPIVVLLKSLTCLSHVLNNHGHGGYPVGGFHHPESSSLSHRPQEQQFHLPQHGTLYQPRLEQRQQEG
ncbi:hypothetical protein BGZ68_008035 [Mortierella alpina]|nr:hypothetical protein BGZ68_008035 [Mortierella alpina]